MAGKTSVTISRVGPDGKPGQSVHFDDMKDFTRACREAPRLLRDEMRRDTMRTKAADVREVSDLSLFAWAQQEAQRIEREREALAEALKDEHHASLALERTPQHVALLDARKVLKDAKAAALGGDMAVLDAKATLKAARASVKRLAEAKSVLAAKEQARNLDESVQASERRLAYALAKGEAPRS